MARDAGPPPPGVGGQDAEVEEQPQKEKSRFPIRLVILLGVAVVAAAAGFLVVQMFLAPRMAIEPDDLSDNSSNQQTVMYDMDELIVNISGEMAAELLVTKITLECANEQVLAAVEANEARIRSALIGLLTTKKFQETQGIVAQERLGREIRDKVNGLLENSGVVGVYFRDLMVQPM